MGHPVDKPFLFDWPPSLEWVKSWHCILPLVMRPCFLPSIPSRSFRLTYPGLVLGFADLELHMTNSNGTANATPVKLSEGNGAFVPGAQCDLSTAPSAKDSKTGVPPCVVASMASNPSPAFHGKCKNSRLCSGGSDDAFFASDGPWPGYTSASLAKQRGAAAALSLTPSLPVRNAVIRSQC